MQPQQAFSYDLDVLRRSARTHYFFQQPGRLCDKYDRFLSYGSFLSPTYNRNYELLLTDNFYL